MPTVKFNGKIIAQSDATVLVEGNPYFPPESLSKEFFKPSAAGTQSSCPWKGTCSYYDVEVDGQVKTDVAWYYPSTKEKAKNIEGYIAFYKNKVEVTS